MDALHTMFAHLSLRDVTAVGLALVLILALARLGRTAATRYIEDTDTRYRTRKAIGTGALALSLVVVLTSVSERFGGLTFALAAASAGAAFALQEVLASTAGWMVLSFGGIYRVGDRVQLGGVVGDVIDIAILRTTLMECGAWVKGDLYNGRVVRVANSHVLKEPVYNYSADFPFLWDEIVVPVTYGSDYAEARAILTRIVAPVVEENASEAKRTWAEMVRRYRIEDAQIEPMVTLVATDNWVEFTVRYVTDFRLRRRTKDRLFTEILRAFDETKGRVVLASTRVASV